MEDASELSLEASVKTQQTEVARSIDGLVPHVDLVSETTRADILRKVEALQDRVRFDGNYPEWVKKHTPIRLETLEGH